MESSSLIPGFRFHPTDHELVMYYLKRKLMGKKIPVNAVTEVNIYDFSPWDLPDKSLLKSGDLEWFFFCPKSKKYTSGSRSNRATENGFWKATGKDRKIEYKGRQVATIKTLVFHLGHALNGERTNWVMHEYNMKDQKLADLGIIQDMFVLCKIFEKEGVGPKNGAQYGAPFKEEEWDRDDDADMASCCGSQLICNNLGPTTLSISEPGSSTLTFSRNETATTNKIATPVNTPASHDDDVMLFEDIVSILDASNKDHNDNINMKGVEVDNMKEVKGVGGNEEDGIYCDLVKLIDLEEFITAEGNKFGAEGGEYSLDMIMGTDDLDADLGRFSVD